MPGPVLRPSLAQESAATRPLCHRSRKLLIDVVALYGEQVQSPTSRKRSPKKPPESARWVRAEGQGGRPATSTLFPKNAAIPRKGPNHGKYSPDFGPILIVGPVVCAPPWRRSRGASKEKTSATMPRRIRKRNKKERKRKQVRKDATAWESRAQNKLKIARNAFLQPNLPSPVRRVRQTTLLGPSVHMREPIPILAIVRSFRRGRPSPWSQKAWIEVTRL